MTLLSMAEVFGHGVGDLSPVAQADRDGKKCPFRGTDCHKSSKTNPIGVCSLTDGCVATSLCPYRFVEGNRIFIDAARLAFGRGVRVAPVPEVKILRERNGKRIGKIDYLVAKLDGEDRPVDFAAVEVQAVYFSGASIRAALDHFLRARSVDEAHSKRRPDYRSSAQKRLMPQLRLKMPVFRRWGKRFFVVVDSLFFAALPEFRRVDRANSEITWLSYPIVRGGASFSLGDPQVVFSVWEDVLDALREGQAPTPAEIVEELSRRIVATSILET